jgi:hypothetical protein
LKTATGTAFAKCSAQNLERQGFKGQNLQNKDFMSDVAVCKTTARALEIFCLFRFEVKVGCHKGSVEFDREPQGLKAHRMIAASRGAEALFFHDADRSLTWGCTLAFGF